MSGCFVEDRVRGSRLEHRQGVRARQHGPPSGRQGRLLPGAAGRQLPGHALRDVPDPRVAGHPGRSASPRSGQRRPDGARHQVQHAGAARRLAAAAEVRDPQRRARLRQDRDLHAQADRRRQRLAACTCTSRSGRTARTCSPATAMPACREFALYYIGGIIKHARALNAITNPGTNSYKRLVPGFEAPVKLAYSAKQPLGVDPHPLRGQPEGPPHRGALPGSAVQPVPGLRAMLMAGLDGVENKIHPGEAATQGPVPPAAGRRREDPDRLPQPGPGARLPGQGPRVPDQGRRVHRRLHRRLHRAEDAGGHALPHDHPPGRVRHVLLAVSPSQAVTTVQKGRLAAVPFSLRCIGRDNGRCMTIGRRRCARLAQGQESLH